tara:strand:- start:1387 stop:2166 length:780 start_codon:yes stop_codon:yes gene_type:complete
VENLKASVVIANYNNAKHINQCLGSLKNQTYKNFEIIFFDDNSDDESLKLLQKFSNIKIIANKKQSKFGSLNQINAFEQSIKQSNGEIIFFLDSDDFFHEKKIYSIVNYFQNNKETKIVFDYPTIIYEDKLIKESKKDKIFKSYWPYIHPTSCISIRKEIFEDLLKSISYKSFNDVWLDFRICIYSQYILKEFNTINENLTFYRKTNTNISSKFNKFSKNWWKRRKEAHEYLFTFAKDNNFKINKNFDFLLTNFVCYFI